MGKYYRLPVETISLPVAVTAFYNSHLVVIILEPQ
jgi:hypothetical protein